MKFPAEEDPDGPVKELAAVETETERGGLEGGNALKRHREFVGTVCATPGESGEFRRQQKLEQAGEERERGAGAGRNMQESKTTKSVLEFPPRRKRIISHSSSIWLAWEMCCTPEL